MPRKRDILIAIGLIAGAAGCMPAAKTVHVPLGELPVSSAFSPASSVGPESYPEQQASFIRGMTAQAEAKGYRITDKRIFVFVGSVPEIGPQWVVLRAELGMKFRDRFHAKEISHDLDLGEPSVSSVWRFSNGDFVAVAQSQPLPDGTALVGYFSLARVH